MKAVMPVRRALGVQTVFNLLGPLTNPAGASAQVMGVYGAHTVPLVAQTMALLGTRHAFVVHGTSEDPDGTVRGLDEISISGPTHLAEVRNGVVTLSHSHARRRRFRTHVDGDSPSEATPAKMRTSSPRSSPANQALAARSSCSTLPLCWLRPISLPDLPTGVALAARTIDQGAGDESSRPSPHQTIKSALHQRASTSQTNGADRILCPPMPRPSASLRLRHHHGHHRP